MNKLVIIGNLTANPELRATQSGKQVCNFTVAVNRRRSGQNEQQETDFFRVSAWERLSDSCMRYLSKGRKVCVVGPVSARSYQANDGSARASLEVMAQEVEFLSSQAESQTAATQEKAYQQQERQAIQTETQSGFTAVETDELPF